MSKIDYTSEQIAQMLRNPNVLKCSEKAITYSKEFKVQAVKRNKEGVSANRIFEAAGFDRNIIGKNKPQALLGSWRKIYNIKGEESLRIETRGKGGGGGRPKTKNISEAERLEMLEAKVEYLKAENDFLKKLRAKKAE